MVLSHEAPVIAMTNSSTCKIKPALEGIGPNTFKLDLSCENEFAAGGGCITSQQLQHEVYSLVQTFMSDMMSQQNLSHFLETHVQPMLEAAPDVVACPQVGNTLGQSLASVSSKVQESLHEEMSDCKTSMLSFWTLPAQQIQRNLSFQDWNFEVTVQLPAGSFWSVFQELLSSKDQTQVLLAVQAHSCNGSPVKDFSPEARQVVSILREVAEDVSNVSDLKAKVMSFAIIVEAIRDGVEIVMAISTATLPLGIAVLAYMVGNARLVIIAVVNVLAAVTGSVLVMEFVVTKLMSVSIFTPPFLIAVVLAMSIDYSLFLLSRFQKETEEPDVPTEVAIRVVMSTSGRIVAQAGVTLACCFSCLLMIPVQLVSAMGAGGLVAVSVAVASSTTLTPALILGTRPSFWRPQKMSKPTCLQRCLRSPNPPDVEAGNDAVDRQVHVSFGFWQRFGQGLKKAAGPVLFFILLLALPCVWKDSFGLPEDMLGLENALPAGSSTTKTLSSIGEAFGYEAILPTGLVLESPPENDTARDQWRLQACHALQKISSEVAKEVGSFTSSAFMGEVMIGGHCLVDDLAGSLLQWSRRSGRDGTVIYVDYPLDPLSPSGQAWTKSLQRAVKKHEIGKWFVQGFGPLMSSQKEKIQELFPKLIISMVCAVLVISTLFTHSFLSSLRALLCLSCTLAVLWCLSSMVFPSGLYYLVPSMMLPFMVGVALDYDIFYTEAVLEECQAGISVKEAGIRALGKTANTISAAGVIMIIAFCPLLLSSTLVLKQIGFMAIGALFMSAFWNTKVVIPVCLQVLGKYSFWPRKFKKRSGPDAIFLMHPAYLVDSFCLFTSPDTDKQWVPSWWMYLFLPFLWLMGFCMAHVLRRLGLPNYLVVDEYKYNGLRVQSWAVLHFGRHFRNSWELYDARLNVAAAARRAEQTGARVLGLGALNKAEFLNRGGLDLLEHLPADRSMCITHGDHLTAAAVVENVLRLVGKCSGKPFLTGAISKTGKAVALALLRRGVPVICHSKSQEAREELETYGLETASHLRHGSKCDLWIIGKYDVFVNDAMPPSAVACVFAVPNPVSRKDVEVHDGATMQIDETRLQGRRANMKLRRHEIYACNAATLLLASQVSDAEASAKKDDLGAVDPMTLETYLKGAEQIGITLSTPR